MLPTSPCLVSADCSCLLRQPEPQSAHLAAPYSPTWSCQLQASRGAWLAVAGRQAACSLALLQQRHKLRAGAPAGRGQRSSSCRQAQRWRRPLPQARRLVGCKCSSAGDGDGSNGGSDAREGEGAQALRPAGHQPEADDEGELVSFAEVQRIAESRGIAVTLRTLGPFYWIAFYDGDARGKQLALSTGFVAPWFGLMHCDTLQVFTARQRGAEGERVRVGPLGLGLLVGGAVFAHGAAAGCRKAEILAINDDDRWHQRLVAYYSRFGFVPVTEVGGRGLADLPHLLVWGGAGTRMDADIAALLRRWTPGIRRAARDDLQ